MEKAKILYQQYVAHAQKIADVNYANALLQWDQETYMPTKSAQTRAKQMATLQVLAHELSSADSYGSLLQELLTINTLTEQEQKNVALSFEDYTKQKKYSSHFVEQMSNGISTAFNSWMEARKQNNFSLFESALANLVELKKEETHLLGFKDNCYNALLNEYEKGCTVNFLDDVFGSLQQQLKPLIDKALSKVASSNVVLKQYFPKEDQWQWGMYLLQQLHFDFEAGRQDISEHPFTTNFSAADVRLTTRIDEYDIGNMTWSCLHELGHGLYEQGLPQSEYGLPTGSYTSLAIHESQSRLWENNVGRSLHFWQYYFPTMQQKFPKQLSNVSLQQFYAAINKVEPSLIRTEADELTYHAHVIIRYEIEKNLLNGNIAVKNLPEVWNELYQKHLQVIVPNDKNGVLQDVHWSHGSFGYFPTYSLGSLYAAQFYAAACKQMESLEEQIEKGETLSLLHWLRENVHKHGRMFTSNELCKRISGNSLQANFFIDYMNNKIDTLNT